MSGLVHHLVFCIDERGYGLPLAQVHRVVRAVDCTPVPHAPDIVIGVIDFHGEILPVMNIRRRFGFEDRAIGVDDVLIIASTSTRRVALAVDRITGVAEYDSDRMITTEALQARSDQIEGVFQSPDGLTLIHNLDRFLNPGEEQLLESALMERREHGI